ncbi:potassium-transporting ATPase subunit KdpC [Sphingobium boeckii]|uniref:Potassium-transporting ATPase KdpC subunit n=1 Tax=Sphingobium boeckii TaxID=1082345 RepID=A0A7W9AFA5_9SPHN|nr:potassium-transporting ATPase subunit KdpC [Sphingobium boeckii]MBB5684608.1 K+-transporting ATPase ATPase C chain [Sphingobium boeckii]
MTEDLKTALRPALMLLIAFALLLGLAYPLAMTGIGKVLFPTRANGSLILERGKVVGSALIGQSFTSTRYFHGRPSATGDGYDAAASSGSNLAPNAKALIERTQADIARIRESGVTGDLPADLVTTSASGLDPHISPEATFLQVPRIAEARELPADRVMALAKASVEQPLLGLIGEPRVNVLMLNRALDRMRP